MEGTEEYHVKRSQPGSKGQRSKVFSHIWKKTDPNTDPSAIINIYKPEHVPNSGLGRRERKGWQSE
jgi:hypothetical protein